MVLESDEPIILERGLARHLILEYISNSEEQDSAKKHSQSIKLKRKRSRRRKIRQKRRKKRNRKNRRRRRRRRKRRNRRKSQKKRRKSC